MSPLEQLQTTAMGPKFWGAHKNQYHWRVNSAFEFVSKQNPPADLIPWLERALPLLYDQLTRYLPDRISRDWEAQVAFQDFDRLCFEFEDSYRVAVEMYAFHHPTRRNGDSPAGGRQ